MKSFPLVSTLIMCLLPLLTLQASAQPAAPKAGMQASAQIEKAIRASFNASRPGVKLDSIKTSEIAGLYTVKVNKGPVLYTSAGGEYFVLGDLYQVAPGGFINLAERGRESDRAQQMSQIKADEEIIFSPEGQPVKASIRVFTDVDCFYCQKLHREVPDLNRLGIEVRYLAYPRAGIGSESYNKIVSAWCAEDKQDAMTRLKNRQRIATNICPGNPVAKQFRLGQKVGVTGTPAMVTAQGRLMPGYMPALTLAAALGVEVAPEVAAELQQKQAAQPQR